jgi:hypothetical protein
MRVSDIVRVVPDDKTDAVRFQLTEYRDHVQGFVLTFPSKKHSPFHQNGLVCIGEATHDSYIPPPGHAIGLFRLHRQMIPPELPLEPFRLRNGFVPFGPYARLALRGVKKKSPFPSPAAVCAWSDRG